MNLLRSFLCVVGVIGAATSQALTVSPPSFAELVAEAETIVRAETLGSRCEWRETSRGRVIVTVVRLRVESTLKGDTVGEFELRHLGGQIGEDRMEIAGVPQFGAGDRDFLFIAGNGKTLCPLVAVPYGRYPVVRLADKGEEFVARADGSPLTSTAQVTSSLKADTARPKLAPAAETPMRAAEFEEAIRHEVNHRLATAAQVGEAASR